MIAKYPDQGRVDTGAVQFGEDWPGVFIRGDKANHIAATLRRLHEMPPPTQRIFLAEIIELLVSCYEPRPNS